MYTRALLVFLAALCVAMNVLIWRAEYGSKSEGYPVPEGLVWRKILTAPEASDLNVYQSGKRTGFCEFSTSIQQEMAQLDETRPPPEGFANRAGYELRVTGNASLGDFTNRVKFDGHLDFFPNRHWRSLDLRILMHGLIIGIVSLATNQSVNVSVTGDVPPFRRTFTFAELQDPDRLLRSVAESLGANVGGLFADWEFSGLVPPSPGPKTEIQWEATRTRYPIGRENVPVYKLETRIFDRPIVIIVSTLGEILRVEIPGDTVATLDELSKE